MEKPVLENRLHLLKGLEVPRCFLINYPDQSGYSQVEEKEQFL